MNNLAMKRTVIQGVLRKTVHTHIRGRIRSRRVRFVCYSSFMADLQGDISKLFKYHHCCHNQTNG